MLLKLNPKVSALSLYDIVHTPGVAADLSHIETRAKTTGFVGDDKGTGQFGSKTGRRRSVPRIGSAGNQRNQFVNALRIGAAELRQRPDTPTGVILSEVVRLASTYGNERSASFVNGLTASLASTLRPGETRS